MYETADPFLYRLAFLAKINTAPAPFFIQAKKSCQSISICHFDVNSIKVACKHFVTIAAIGKTHCMTCLMLNPGIIW